MNFEMLKKIREMSNEQLADIAMQLAVREPDTFRRLLLGDKIEYRIYRDSGEYLGSAFLTDAEVEEIRAAGATYAGFGATRNKIAAIKKVREITSLGLLEAKLLVEKYDWY